MVINALPNEQELILRFKDGDEEALRILFAHCESILQNRIERKMSKALKRRLSVADVLQEARIAAFNRRHDLEYRGPGSFRKWLLGIVDLEVSRGVKRHANTGLRSINREVSRNFRMDTGRYPGNEHSPSQVAMGLEAEEAVNRALADLPDDYRVVLHLTRLEGLDFAEVAERMGRSQGAVRKLYGRALLAFTKAFNRMGGDPHA